MALQRKRPMSDNKELYYRKNATSHFASATKHFISIIGIPVGTLYFLLASIEMTLAIGHHIVGWYRALR